MIFNMMSVARGTGNDHTSEAHDIVSATST